MLKLPRPRMQSTDDGRDTGPVSYDGNYEHLGSDILAGIREETIGHDGMKIDRMFFARFEDDRARRTPTIVAAVEAGQWDQRHRLREPRGLRQARGVSTTSTSCAAPPPWTAASRCARFWRRCSA